MRLSHKFTVLIILVCVFEALFVGLVLFLFKSADKQIAEQIRAQQIISTADRLSGLGRQAMSTIGLYSILTLKRRSKNLATSFKRECDLAYKTLDDLEALVQENKKMVKTVKEVRLDCNKFLAALRTFKTRVERRNFPEDEKVFHLLDFQEIGGTLLDSIGNLSQTALVIDKKAQKSYEELRATISYVLLMGIIANIGVAVGFVALINRMLAQRFGTLQDNSLRLARGEPLRPPMRGADEFADLDRTFHSMAEALEEARRKETLVVTNAMDVICSLDANGSITEVNPAFSRLLSIEREKCINRELTAFIAPADQQRVEEELARARTSQEFNLSFETAMTVAGGIHEKTVLWSLRWVARENSYFCIARDITRQKELETAKQNFIAMVSHDLRSPLTALRNTFHLLETGTYGELDERGFEKVQASDKSVERLISLINNLLDIEAMEAGQLTLSPKEFPIMDAIELSINSIRPLAERKNIDLDFEPLELVVLADADRTVQLIVNLLDNAVKFSKTNSQILVSLIDKGTSAEVRVQDMGPGLTSQQKSIVFERFKILSNSNDTKGSGLGLAICKSIVDAHQGEIGVDSELGKGSTFWFRLPKP